jgi:hypothetical protein
MALFTLGAPVGKYFFKFAFQNASAALPMRFFRASHVHPHIQLLAAGQWLLASSHHYGLV